MTKLSLRLVIYIIKRFFVLDKTILNQSFMGVGDDFATKKTMENISKHF